MRGEIVLRSMYRGEEKIGTLFSEEEAICSRQIVKVIASEEEGAATEVKDMNWEHESIGALQLGNW
jgi:hypothetical protein